MDRTYALYDGNTAAAHVAHKTNEVIAIYPITPASPMGELSDMWTASGRTNIWGHVPEVIEMQSEAGAAGAVHGSLQAGTLTTTFTASQGLLLMIPNMFKIAGELTPTVFHIAARTVATQALSIFGDHSDVMSARTTGWGMMFSGSIQEVHDLALISHAATLESRVPFLHAFDGFRTSHEIQKIELVTDDIIRSMISDEAIKDFRLRALTPERPVVRGTAQNPDVFFQSREACNPYYNAVPAIVQGLMDSLAEKVGRQYHLFDYIGAPDAERVMILMGSGAETAEETVEHLVARGEKIGMIKVRLFRPFSVEHLLKALPATTKKIVVMDRTKEPGGAGEPLYQDVITAIAEGYATGNLPMSSFPSVVGGRYALSSKEFTPAMVKGIFDEQKNDKPRNHFTIGINDDVTFTNLDYDPSFDIEPDDVSRSVFWGLGADGTVGANKNTIKIIGEETDYYAQGYFVYDSKKSGAQTVSHLRFGPRPIKSTYLIKKANFVAVHQFGFLERYDTLSMAEDNATFLLNSPIGADTVWSHLPQKVQQQIIDKNLRFFVIDAHKVARDIGLGGRTNTIMQTCYFALDKVIPKEEAIKHIKTAIRKTYGKRGESIVRMNNEAVDAAIGHLEEVTVPATADSGIEFTQPIPDSAPDFVRRVTATMMAGNGDDLPVSLLPADGTFPVSTTKWEKRNISQEAPLWESDLCIQCGKCVMVCPHSVIRAKAVPPSLLDDAPDGFQSIKAGWREYPDQQYTLQVAVEDCTGCKLCVEVCPAKDKSQVGRKALNMVDQLEIREAGKRNWDFFLSLPEHKTVTDDGASPLKYSKVKDVQLLDPHFEFSGACAGCGETPYVRLISQLFGERMIVANATGCSSIYGGNLPTTPWSTNAAGRGPAWSNSLFEDNAEFGLGMRVSLDQQAMQAKNLVQRLRKDLTPDFADELLHADQTTDEGLFNQRARIETLKAKLADIDHYDARQLELVADALLNKSVWIMGGDGWAYDIGYGGVDHVLASGRNVNVFVMDTEVYSNTGGQASKATGLGAVAKFAAAGKRTPKKDLGKLAMDYGYVYVAQIAMGSSDNQTIKALREAEAYDGPSLVIAYSHCIAHGFDMARGLDQQSLAVKTGYWPLYRFDPRLKEEGKNPLQLDSRKPSQPLRDFVYNESRYNMLIKTHPKAAAELLDEAQEFVEERWENYEKRAAAVPKNGEK